MQKLCTGGLYGGNRHGSTKKADKANTVECLEQGKALIDEARLDHPLHLSLSLDVLTSVLPQDLDCCGRDSKVGDTQTPFTLIKLTMQVIDHHPSPLSSTQKSFGDRRAMKVTGVGTLEVVSRGPAHRRYRP